MSNTAFWLKLDSWYCPPLALAVEVTETTNRAFIPFPHNHFKHTKLRRRWLKLKIRYPERILQLHQVWSVSKLDKWGEGSGWQQPAAAKNLSSFVWLGRSHLSRRVRCQSLLYYDENRQWLCGGSEFSSVITYVKDWTVMKRRIHWKSWLRGQDTQIHNDTELHFYEPAPSCSWSVPFQIWLDELV